jgi:hypothetical protein
MVWWHLGLNLGVRIRHLILTLNPPPGNEVQQFGFFQTFPCGFQHLQREISIGDHSFVGAFYSFRPKRAIRQMNQEEIEPSFISAKILLLVQSPEIG